jgi:hypothetical protein
MCIGESQRLKLGTVVCCCMHCNHQKIFSSAYWQGQSHQTRVNVDAGDTACCGLGTLDADRRHGFALGCHSGA